MRALHSEPDGPGVRRARVEYVFADARWTHRALAEADLVVDAYLTDDHTWARARPAGRSVSPG